MGKFHKVIERNGNKCQERNGTENNNDCKWKFIITLGIQIQS